MLTAVLVAALGGASTGSYRYWAMGLATWGPRHHHYPEAPSSLAAAAAAAAAAMGEAGRRGLREEGGAPTIFVPGCR